MASRRDFSAAEVDGIGLDQIGIELVLADELAEAVADLGAAVATIDRLGRQFLGSREGGSDSANDPISSTEQMPMP